MSVNVMLRDSETTETVTGAILGDDIYVLFKIAFHWTNGAKKSAAYTTVDGKDG